MHNLPIVLYARSIGAVWPRCTCCEAAKLGAVDVLQYLHEENDYPHPIIKNAFLIAVWMGHTDCVRYLSSIDNPLSDGVCELAAYRGHLDTLKYLYESGYRCNTLTSWMCTIHDQVECLQYLHESGCPWDCTTPTYCKHNWTDSSAPCSSCTGATILHHHVAITTYLGVIGLFEKTGLCWYPLDTSEGCTVQIKPNLLKIYGAHDLSCTFGIAALCTYYNATRCLQYAYSQRCAWPDNPFLLPNSSDQAIQQCIQTLCRPKNLQELCHPAENHTFKSSLTSGALLKPPTDDSSISSNNIREAMAKSGQKCSAATSAKCKRETREKKLSNWSTICQWVGPVVQRDMYSYRIRGSFLVFGAMVLVSTANSWL